MSKGVMMLHRLGFQAGSRRRVAALVVLAAAALLFVFLHDAQPAQANHGGNHLTGLGITGEITRGSVKYTFQLIPNPVVFNPNTESYTIRVSLRSSEHHVHAHLGG